MLQIVHVFYLQPPFVGGNRDKVQQKIVKDKIKLPAFLSSEAHSLLKGVNFFLFSRWFPFSFLENFHQDPVTSYMQLKNKFEKKFDTLVSLNQLLQKESSRRLGSGSGGSNEIRNHKWFKSINWRKLDAREIQPSFRPNVPDKNCIANFDERWTSMPLLDSPVSSPVSGDNNFKGFTYVRPSPFLQKLPSSLGGIQQWYYNLRSSLSITQTVISLLLFMPHFGCVYVNIDSILFLLAQILGCYVLCFMSWSCAVILQNCIWRLLL